MFSTSTFGAGTQARCAYKKRDSIETITGIVPAASLYTNIIGATSTTTGVKMEDDLAKRAATHRPAIQVPRIIIIDTEGKDKTYIDTMVYKPFPKLDLVQLKPSSKRHVTTKSCLKPGARTIFTNTAPKANFLSTLIYRNRSPTFIEDLDLSPPCPVKSTFNKSVTWVDDVRAAKALGNNNQGRKYITSIYNRGPHLQTMYAIYPDKYEKRGSQHEMERLNRIKYRKVIEEERKALCKGRCGSVKAGVWRD